MSGPSTGRITLSNIAAVEFSTIFSTLIRRRLTATSSCSSVVAAGRRKWAVHYLGKGCYGTSVSSSPSS